MAINYYPINFSTYNVGSTIPQAVIEHAYGMQISPLPSAAEMQAYKFHQLKMKEAAERYFLGQGMIVTVVVDQDTLLAAYRLGGLDAVYEIIECSDPSHHTS